MTKRVWRRVDPDLRRRMLRLASKGWSQQRIAEEVGRTQGVVSRVVRPLGGVWRGDTGWEPSPRRLSLDERVEVRAGLDRGETFTVIAGRLGRAVSTVSREVAANGGRWAYAAMAAHRRAAACARRPKVTKLAANPVLCSRVVADLEVLWSPEQIARRLRAEHPDDATMWVSHETIYKSIYIQGRGELRRELARCLRTGRAQRRPHHRLQQGSRIRDMVMISERPAEVEDRAVPGHWEGDLLLGKDGRSAIATLVERSTRYVLLARVSDQRAETVRQALVGQITQLPAHLRRSLTWDQGREMAQHAQFSVDTGIQVFFCDPRSPWQRGSNENTNGLLRQYFPKGTPLAQHTQDHLDAVAAQLNGRPRQTLNWMTPSEQLTELLATTG
jgi:transposase, IS30 family